MNPPSALHSAMSRERKPFTYTPGGLDLSEIKSERMAKRLMRNAMNQGVPEKPVQQIQSPTTPTTPVALPNYNCLPVQVFPAFNLPANPKSLLRSRSNPDPKKNAPRPSLPSQLVNAKLSETNNNTASSKPNNNVNSRPTSIHEYNSPNVYSPPTTKYGSNENSSTVLPEISYDAEYFDIVPKYNSVDVNKSYIPINNEERISSPMLIDFDKKTSDDLIRANFSTYCKPNDGYADNNIYSLIDYHSPTLGLVENKILQPIDLNCHVNNKTIENNVLPPVNISLTDTRPVLSPLLNLDKIENETDLEDRPADIIVIATNNANEDKIMAATKYYEDLIPSIEIKIDEEVDNSSGESKVAAENFVPYTSEESTAKVKMCMNEKEMSVNGSRAPVENNDLALNNIEDSAMTENEQKEVKVVKKQVKVENKETHSKQNGDSKDVEAELTLKLPTKKSGAKTETKVEVLNKLLPDGTVEEIKTTTTKTTIDGKTEITTKTEKRTLPKEEADAAIEVEEEEEEEEEEEAEEVVQEPVKTILKTESKKGGSQDTVIKKEEKSEVSTTKKVVVVQAAQEEEEEEEVEEEEVEEEPQIEKKETKVEEIAEVVPEKQNVVEVEEDEEEEVEEKQVIQKVEEKKEKVQEVEEEEEEDVEDEEEIVEETKVTQEKPQQKDPEPDEQVSEVEEEVEEQEDKEVKVKTEETKKEEDEESEYTEEEVSDDEEVKKPARQEPATQEPSQDPEEPQEPEKPSPSEAQKEESKPTEPAEEKPAEKIPEIKIPLREPSVPLEKVEDVEIKPIRAGQGFTKSHTESKEIITSTEKPSGPLSTQTEYNRMENIVTVNRTTKTLDRSYEELTNHGVPTVKTYFAPNRERVSTSPQPSRPYQSNYSTPQPERRHSLLLERLSMERQPQLDVYQSNYQSYDQQKQWLNQEPQSEVVNSANVKPSTITNSQWYQQKQDNAIYNNVTDNTSNVQSQWSQPLFEPQYQSQYSPQPPQPQPQQQPQTQYHPQPQYQPQYQAQPQAQYQPPQQQYKPQPQYKPSYETQDSSKFNSSYQQNNYQSSTPKPSWGSSLDQQNQYSSYQKDSSESYQKSQQYSSSYVPPPWEQDANYVVDNSQNYYNAPPPASTFSPSSNTSWQPPPPQNKFVKPPPTAFIPPAPNQSFVKTGLPVEPPKLPGRKTYYSEYERRYISVPESTYVPGSESKYQHQPDPSPQYYYDNNEPTEPQEPQWRRELREFTEKSQTQQTTESSARPPWEEETKIYTKAPEPYSSTPTWSQTVRPRSWRERSFESEYIGSQEYQKTNTNTIGRNRPLSSYGPSIDAIPERSRGVSVDRYNPNSYHSPIPAEHPPVPTQILDASNAPHKNYHNPNVPAYHAQSRASAEPREHQSSYQPNRVYVGPRENPIQSRSFRYLQYITGTED